MIGAHPDDCEIKAGGTTKLLTEKNNIVKFISISNGDKGHNL